MALALARIGVAAAEAGAPLDRLRLEFRIGGGAAPGAVRVDRTWLHGQGQAVAIADGEERICRIFSSAGTTGSPKFIPVSHRVMREGAMGGWRGLRPDPAIRIVATRLGGAMGYPTVIRTFRAGGTLVLTNHAQIADAISRHGLTSITTAPFSLHTIIAAIPPELGPFPSLRAIEVGGATLPAQLGCDARRRLCPVILSNYVSTEAGHIAGGPIDTPGRRPGAVGVLSSGCHAEALDPAGNVLPPGRSGRIRARGPQLAGRYIWEAEARDDAFADGWVLTGDIGAVEPDHMVTLLGRVSEVIIVGATKVNPEVIEAAMLRLPLVSEAAAFGVADAAGIERIWVAIVTATRIDDAVLNEFCARALPSLSPSRVLRMKSLRRAANGKIIRHALTALAGDMLAGEAEPA